MASSSGLPEPTARPHDLKSTCKGINPAEAICTLFLLQNYLLGIFTAPKHMSKMSPTYKQNCQSATNAMWSYMCANTCHSLAIIEDISIHELTFGLMWLQRAPTGIPVNLSRHICHMSYVICQVKKKYVISYVTRAR